MSSLEVKNDFYFRTFYIQKSESQIRRFESSISREINKREKILRYTISKTEPLLERLLMKNAANNTPYILDCVIVLISRVPDITANV